MKSYLISLTIIGMASLGMAWMPAITQRFRISYSIVYVLIGVLLYSLVDALPWPNPIWEETYAVHLTELIIIISLMGTWSGKEMTSLSPPPLRTVRTRHRVHGSSNRRTPRGALLL